jgi:hypothetical protein
VIQFCAKVTPKDGVISIAWPAALAPAVAVLLERSRAKCGGYLNVRFDLPHRPRSTGWKSQNHHLRGHVRQLCDYTGYSMSEMMQFVKEDTPSWPAELKEFRGKRRIIHVSEADISVEVASEAIEICHRIAVDNEWILKESIE